MFTHIEYGGNRGMAQGIVPRFFLQIYDLASLAISKDEFDKKSEVFDATVMPELKNLYNVFHEVIGLIEDYKTGVSSGKYYNLSPQGTPIINRGSEERIKNLVKDYIIRNKITLVNFAQCGLMNDEGFDFGLFSVFNNKREKRKEDYLNQENHKFSPLINLIEKANGVFIQDLFELRNSFEHHAFHLNKFDLKLLNGSPEVKEPQLAGKILSDKMKFYYENTLDYIERVLAYYFGILGEEKKSGFIQLHEDCDCDYSRMKYKFQFAIGGIPCSPTSKRCAYD